MAKGSFTGFPPAAVTFLQELVDNNNKVWFEAHREQYEECLKEPALLFGEAMCARLQEVAGGPPPAASLFRIHRDIRFSKDKTPYKTYVGVPFGDPAHKKGESPGFYFHLDGWKLMLGAGMHTFDKANLESYRQAVLDGDRGARLGPLVDELEDQGYEVWGETYKRVPRGYDPEHPRASLLRHSGLFSSLSLPHPPELQGPELVDFCFEHYRAMSPLQRWLSEMP
jgi:uncharacterized protein (TIGR02453 family)